MARRAFVTGGTGFVGLALVQALVKQGWDVTALHRKTASITQLSATGATLVSGAITDPGTLSTAIPPNIDTLFHVAGNTSLWRGGNAEQTHDNVDGTRNVVEAAIVRGVRRLVVTSSITAYGKISGVLDETVPSSAMTAPVNYWRSKYAAQEIARAAVPRGLEVVILQPGAILGPGDRHGLARLFPLIRDNKLPGAPNGMMSFAHIREIVRAHIAAADCGENGGQYLLAGTEATMLDLIAAMARELGKPPPKTTLADFLVNISAKTADFVSIFTKTAPVLTPEVIANLWPPFHVDCAKAGRDLGYKTVPLAEMLRDSHDWLKSEGIM